MFEWQKHTQTSSKIPHYQILSTCELEPQKCRVLSYVVKNPGGGLKRFPMTRRLHLMLKWLKSLIHVFHAGWFSKSLEVVKESMGLSRAFRLMQQVFITGGKSLKEQLTFTHLQNLEHSFVFEIVSNPIDADIASLGDEGKS